MLKIKYSERPKTLNGYPVIGAKVHNRCVTVMVQKPGEYVIATWWPELKTTWWQGHYFRIHDLHKAQACFHNVCRRNEER